MELLENIKTIIIENMHKTNEIDIIATMAFFELLENDKPVYKYCKEVIYYVSRYTCMDKELLQTYINCIFEKNNINKIRNIIVYKISQCYHLNDIKLFNDKKINANKFLKSYAVDFFKNISSNNKIWSSLDTFKIVIMHNKYNMITDYDFEYACMALLIINKGHITLDNYLKFMI